MSKQHDATAIRLSRWVWIVAATGLTGFGLPALHAAQTDIIGPTASLRFGSDVALLANGNFVVVDADGPVSGVGSVHLYSADGNLISTVTGSSPNDHIGSGGIIVLPGGHAFLVKSPEWDINGEVDAGAVTWIDGASGLNGLITPDNSLVGSSANDKVGLSVTVLSNGNYVVNSPNWDNDANADAGAVTWGNGSSGIAGSLSGANSMIGTATGDHVGNAGVTPLDNGDYLVSSYLWDNGSSANVGAVTLCNGASGCIGAVSVADSLIGIAANSLVGSKGVTLLGNGNYVVNSPSWDNGATTDVGAITWIDGAIGPSGTVSSINSLVGTVANDRVGILGVTALSNGNYVVASPYWNNSSLGFAGAVTWGNGDGGTAGPVSSANSLVGASTNDLVGFGGVTALGNGNYVVASQFWDNGAIVDAGAITWGNGTGGTVGPVTSANSLVGSTANDQIGSQGVTALSNGNYVVAISSWDNGAVTDAGAVTWGNGSSGIVGNVTAANSLVGTTVNDQLGNLGVAALSDGNYVVVSSAWDNGAIADAGAVTWANGHSGIVGNVTAANSLVGSSASDQVGNQGVTVLSNGNYVVLSSTWDDGAIADVGAISWCRAGGSTLGPVTPLNSRIGTHAGDSVGKDGVTVYADGSYVVASGAWDNGSISKAGAISLASVRYRLSKHIESWNSVLGTVDSGGPDMSYAYDPVLHRLIVGRPGENIVSLFTADQLFADGLEP